MALIKGQEVKEEKGKSGNWLRREFPPLNVTGVGGGIALTAGLLAAGESLACVGQVAADGLVGDSRAGKKKISFQRDLFT